LFIGVDSLHARAQDQYHNKSKAEVNVVRSGKLDDEPREGVKGQEQREGLTEDQIRARGHVPTLKDYPNTPSSFESFFDPFQVWYVLKREFGYRNTKVERVLQKPPNSLFEVVVHLQHDSRKGGRFTGAGSSNVSLKSTALLASSNYVYSYPRGVPLEFDCLPNGMPQAQFLIYSRWTHRKHW